LQCNPEAGPSPSSFYQGGRGLQQNSQDHRRKIETAPGQKPPQRGKYRGKSLVKNSQQPAAVIADCLQETVYQRYNRRHI